MTIYVDEPQTWDVRFKDYCHLWSDTMDVDELNQFARLLGLKPEWIQCSHGLRCKDFWHYDISKGKRARALQLGAEYKPLLHWLKELPQPTERK